MRSGLADKSLSAKPERIIGKAAAARCGKQVRLFGQPPPCRGRVRTHAGFRCCEGSRRAAAFSSRLCLRLCGLLALRRSLRKAGTGSFAATRLLLVASFDSCVRISFARLSHPSLRGARRLRRPLRARRYSTVEGRFWGGMRRRGDSGRWLSRGGGRDRRGPRARPDAGEAGEGREGRENYFGKKFKFPLDSRFRIRIINSRTARKGNGPKHGTQYGALAQLGERMAGSHEVRGSIPLGSTINPAPLERAAFFIFRHDRNFFATHASGYVPKSVSRWISHRL